MAKNKNKETRAKLPTKTTMNLYQKEVTDNSMSRVLPVALLLIVLILVFAKFGVFERLNDLSRLNGEVSKAEAELELFNNKLSDYNEVEGKYLRYTGSFMYLEESTLVDRLDIINLINKKVSNVGALINCSITGNTVSLEVSVGVLDDVRKIRRQLEDVSWVTNITVNTASKNAYGRGADVTAQIVFDVIYDEEIDYGLETVEAEQDVRGGTR